MKTKLADIEADVAALRQRLEALSRQEEQASARLLAIRGEYEIVSCMHDGLRQALYQWAQWADGMDPLTASPEIPPEPPL